MGFFEDEHLHGPFVMRLGAAFTLQNMPCDEMCYLIEL